MGYTVAVLGSSGFIGSFVIEKLRSMGHQVIGIDLVEPRVPVDVFVRVDATRLEDLEKVMSSYSPDVVINLIGLPHIPTCEKNPHLSYVTNVLTAHNVLETVRVSGIERYVFTSSAAVYGAKVELKAVDESQPPAPTSIYGWHKLEAEMEAKGYSERYGVQAVILRPFNVYGSDPEKGRDVASIFLRKLLNNEEITVQGPRKVRDFIYIDDAALAIAKAAVAPLKEQYTVINIGRGEPTRIIELLHTIAEALGVEPRYRVVDPEDETGYYADNTRMRRLLGIEPLPLREGVRRWLQRLGITGR